MSTSFEATSKTFAAAALVPGLPHLLRPEASAGYGPLKRALEALGDRFAEQGVERVVYYSTQWISVLGHLYQARPDLRGRHVDENWHDVCDLPFAFRVDAPFAAAMARAADGEGYQTKLVDYDGFPVDTGTIVADTLLNKGRFSANMISCCVYSDYADTVKLAGTVRRAIEAGGKRTAVVVVSMLSGRFFTTEIDPREDHVASESDDRWNKRMLSLLGEGKLGEAERLVPEYAAQCKVDMGFKALASLKGVGAAAEGRKLEARAYGALYGTGAAVVEA